MIPDLGKYAVPVLASYGVSLLLIAGLVWASLRRSDRVRRALEDVETRRKSNG
ncbi:MAG: heme exporter protein CcmD [Roseovarius sp.]|nr:heme exporter protein CcmD [Roseovarius sp.]